MALLLFPISFNLTTSLSRESNLSPDHRVRFILAQWKFEPKSEAKKLSILDTKNAGGLPCVTKMCRALMKYYLDYKMSLKEKENKHTN